MAVLLKPTQTQAGVKQRFEIKGFTITDLYIGNKPWPAVEKGQPQNYHNHRITVSKDGKRCSFEFWGSIMNPKIPNEAGAFWAVCCFASDAVSGLMDFEEFCNEFGYVTDSRRAERTWRACQRSANKIKRCFGDVYEFQEIFNDSNTFDEKQEK